MSTRSELQDERDFLLRSLEDLEREHAAGDIDDHDFESLRAGYTARAATVLRGLDALDAPDPARAPDAPDPATGEGAGPTAAGPVVPAQRRRRRPLVIAAAAVVLVGLLVTAVLAWSGSRLPSGVATGGAVGTERTAQLLLGGARADAKGDDVTALRDFETVLRTDPNQVQALTEEGWILSRTQQPALLRQGIGLLDKAVRLSPSYPPARVYRGVAHLTQGDDADAAVDLQWYLDHNPDPALIGRVQTALAAARARVAATPPAPAPSPPTPPASAPSPTAAP